MINLVVMSETLSHSIFTISITEYLVHRNTLHTTYYDHWPHLPASSITNIGITYDRLLLMLYLTAIISQSSAVRLLLLLSLILLILLRDEGRILRIVIGADIPTNIEICEELVESSDAIKFQSSLALKLSSYVMLGLLFDEIFKKIAFLLGSRARPLHQ